uniref:Transmembrane protein 69 n=1 Tax=Leptobrachium leishanense TaxID=445787 RepID=A0A8C5WFZ4_9ANUR
MLPCVGWRSFPLALQLYQRTSSLCKPNLTALIPTLRLERSLVTPCRPAFQVRHPMLQPRTGLHMSASRQKRRTTQEEPEKRELDLLRYDMRSLKDTPKPALYLGLGGLIPFVAAPLAMSAFGCYYPELAYAQVAYGASILSFLGGARWGFTLPEGSPAKPDWINLANSAVPAILAWIALLFKDTVTEAVLIVVIGLGISLHSDLSLLPTYPSWFKALRAVLTLVAVASLVATLMVSSFPKKSLIRKTS